MKKAGRIFAIAVPVIFLLLVFAYIIGVATDIIELRETGYDIVYVKNLVTKVCVQGLITLCFFGIFSANCIMLCHNMISMGSELLILKRKSLILSFCFFVSAIVGIVWGKNLYSDFMAYTSSVFVGASDPIFGKDIGYYMFQMPFLSGLFGGARAIMIFQTAFTLIAYLALYVQKDIDSFKEIMHETAIFIHVIINAIVFIALFMVSCRFNMENLLYGEFAGVQGAGYIDTTIWINYYKIIPFVTVAVLIAAILFLAFKKIKVTLITISILPILSLAFSIMAGVTNMVLVSPYEAAVETPYIQNNIMATRAAFGLDSIEKEYFAASDRLSLKDVTDNEEVFDGACITDKTQELAIINSTQSMRSFYTFTDLDVSSYTANGKERAVMISARELDTDRIPKTSKNYISEHMQYTHGYGVVMKEANGVGEYFIKNIPINYAQGTNKITEPRIYFGEKTNDYALVGTRYTEVDYIEGENTVEYRYTGNAGIPMTFANRLLFSLKTGDMSILTASYINNESRLLTNRNILERAKNAAPFLKFDKDAYIVIDSAGRLKWVIDAYTISDRYPYSESYDEINYIRNSVKAVIDAFDGTLTFYITDSSDAIIKMYSKLYPGLFSAQPLPGDIAMHTKYPSYLFNLQSEVYKKYHTTDARTLFASSDEWALAKEGVQNTENTAFSPAFNFALADSGKKLVTAFNSYTIKNEDNITAILFANREGLKLYSFPKGITAAGMSAMKNTVDTEASVSEALSSWTMSKSTVVKGGMHVIPVKNSLIFAQSVYVTTEDSDTSELKKVIAIYNGKAAAGDTLKEAVLALFGKTTPLPKDEEAHESEDDLIGLLINQFADVKAYSKEGNFESFGAALSEMEKTVDRLESLRTQEGDE